MAIDDGDNHPGARTGGYSGSGSGLGGAGASAGAGFGGFSGAASGYGGASSSSGGGFGSGSGGFSGSGSGYGGVGAGASGGLGMGSGGFGGVGSGYGGGGAGSSGNFSGYSPGAGFGSPGGAGGWAGAAQPNPGGVFGSLNGGYSGLGGAWSKSSIEGLHGMNSWDRQLVGDIAGKIQRDYGLSLSESIIGASELARSIYGELGEKWGTKKNAAAVGRVALNRLGLAKTKGAYGGTLNGVLGGFDASGYAPRTRTAGIGPEGNAAFQAAAPGTSAYQTGLDALQGQLFGTGPSLPEGVVNATNYRANFMGAPSWERGVETTQFGPHTFSNPDPARSPGAVAASNRQIAALGSRPGISPLSGPSGTVSAGFGVGPGASAMASLNPRVNPTASGGIGPVAAATGGVSIPGASASAAPGTLKSRVVDGVLEQYMDYGPPASPSAATSYSDVPQDSWGDYLGNILGSGFEKAKTYGGDYLERAKSPENIAAFAKQNPMAALGLASAFGSLSPGQFGPGQGGWQDRQAWFQSPSAKPKPKAKSDSKDDKKKPGDKPKQQQPPKWVFPTMLTRPYTRIT